MRWPWVSRFTLECAFATLSEERAQKSYLQIRYDALLEKYHALRIQGANPESPKQVVEAKEPDAVQYAINERSNGRHGLKLHLTGWAAAKRRENMADDEIIGRINNWQSESDD